MVKTAIITGITGQDGAYLSELLLKNDYEIIGLIRNHAIENFNGLEYLNIKDKIEFIEIDLLNPIDVDRIIEKIKPQEIYNLASQSSVGLSYKMPAETINFNIMSATNILESIRTLAPEIKFFQASSTEIFGNALDLPVTENSPMDPVNPYAISKASVQQLIKFYRENYKIFATSGIFCNHESYLRHPDFFVKKVITQAIKIKNNEQETIKLGNIEVKRDIGYAPDYVKAMWLVMQQNKPDDYIICSGKSICLKDIVNYIFDKLKINQSKIIIDKDLFRENELQDVYGDSSKAKMILGWNYEKSFYDIIDILIEEEYKNLHGKRENSIYRASIS